MSGKKSSDLFSLYFHIPFCKKKCDYCHFFVLPEKENDKDLLLNGFKMEWERYLPLLQNKKISTLYFGGGTPALFGPDRIAKVIEWVKSSHPYPDQTTEVTLEANPEGMTSQLITEYAQAGINRLSIGIQTLDDNLLMLLGRGHSSHVAMNAVHTAYDAGIKNISIDLMYDLPQQTLAHWTHTLKEIESLPISHLSLYNLTFEPHTVFYKKKALLTPLLPNEDISLSMYLEAVERLERLGLKQYEISAFAKEGSHSHHNSGYWTGRPFIGLGPSAFSFWEGRRFRNIPHLRKYLTALNEGLFPIDFEEQLAPDALRRERLVIQLRLVKGIDISTFQRDEGALDKVTLDTIDKLLCEGFLEHRDNHLALTRKGILFYDSVASELI